MGFSVVDAMRTGLAVFARRSRTMVGASLLFLLPAEIGFAFLDLDLDRGWGEAFGLREAAGLVAITVGSGLAFIAAGRAYRSDFGLEAARWTIRRTIPVIALTVVACAGFLLGLLLLVIPGLILITRWSLAFSAYSETGGSWHRALLRSNELVRGRSWRMFCLVALLSALYLLLDFGVWQVVGNVTDSDVLAFGAAAAVGLVAMPLQAAMLFAAYDQLRSTTPG